MKLKFACLLVLAMPALLSAQPGSEVLLKLGKHPVTKAEFVRLYRKNNQSTTADSLKKTPEEYLSLFVNFKLKVLEAESLGRDTSASFKTEFKQYRDQLAQSYLTQTDVSDSALQRAYRRRITEVRASHILIAIGSKASPDDERAAYEKCLSIRTQLLAGADFAETARRYSNDPSAARNGGDLGYFTAFQMVQPFEDAAFELPIDSLSMPVRTRFGLHLIKVTDRQPSKGQIRLAQIVKRLQPNTSQHELAAATHLLDSLKNAARSGADFGNLARRFSDDKQSAANGGVLPWLAATGMPAELVDEVFNRTRDNEISEVVRSAYGLYLFKRLELKSVPGFAETRDWLTEKIRSNPQFAADKQQAFVLGLKNAYGFHENRAQTDRFIRQIEDALKSGKMLSEITEADTAALFGFAGQTCTRREFADYLVKQKIDPGPALRSDLYDCYTRFTDACLLRYEDSVLETKYPEFADLAREYHDGILLFNLSEEKIWNQAKTDSLGFARFCAKNKNRFHWGPRFDGWVIRCETQQVRDYLDAIFDEDPRISVEELEDLLNVGFQNQAFIQKGIFARGSNALVDYLVWNGPQPSDYADGLHFVRGNRVAPRAKTPDEARGQYLAAYQDYLEQQWIGALRKKYPVKVNRSVLKSIESIK